MRIDCLAKLLSITKEQHEALLNDDYERFIALLKKRQVLIDRISLDFSFETTPPSERERAFLEELGVLDKQNQEEYKKQLEYTKQELKHFNAAKRQNNQYVDPYSAIRSGFHFDHK